jgi:hypothetical protein
MPKIQTTAFLVLTPTERSYKANEHGVRPVVAFKADRLTQNRPATKQGEIATRVNITIDSSLFDKIAPVIDIELSEGDIFANVQTQVAIDAEGDPEG